MTKIYTLLLTLIITCFGIAQTDPSQVPFNPGGLTTDTIISPTALRTTETTNDYTTNNASELIFLKLNASTTTNSYTTDFYFNDNASLGFDLGYDAGIFGITPNFALYSNLVEDNTGINISLQAVNTTDLASVSFPLGLNASQGVQVTIRISTSTLPETVSVYLDDTVSNTSTLLNNTDYIFTPTTNLSGTGRFFLRTSIPSVTYTYNGSWSPSDPNSNATTNDDIIITSGDATINTDILCNSVTVNPGAGLMVDAGVTLSTTNGLILESNSTSYSSLIHDGLVNGTITYMRHVNINGSGTTGSNDLISAPLTGQAFNAFATANPNILSNNDETLYLFGPFEKNSGSYATYSNTETATLDPGVGYRAASDNNDTFTFTGLANNTTVSSDIVNSGTNNEEWNLIGNPYPSYLNVQDFLLHDVGGLVNFQLFDLPTAAIYGYDGSALNGWTIYNLANITASTVIAPGQGFFVSADADNAPLYDLEFTPTMRRTDNGDDFIVGRNAELIYLKLNASTSDNSYNTDFYFNDNSSLGFDLGYDAAIWGNTTPDFAIYSHLVEGNAGASIALQSLNNSTLSGVTIPLGVHANQGKQLTFSIADMTLPQSVNVYLEDVVANTSTLLNNSEYIITPTSAISGTGRFFLRTSEDALSTTDNKLYSLNIYALNSSKELVISGQLQNSTVVHIYDLQGRLILNTPVNTANLENRIDISNVNDGVYVVTVENNGQQKSQKVIIK